MKKFMILLLTLCNITPALAEDIINIDTPVNWSYSAIYITFNVLTTKEGEKSPENAHSIAEHMVKYYINANTAKSPKWLCEIYNDYVNRTETNTTEKLNCYNIFKTLVEYHNKQIERNKAPDRINTSTPDEPFFWLQSAIYDGCKQFAHQDEYKKEDCISAMSKAFNYNFMYKELSINQLLDFCTENLYPISYRIYNEFDGPHLEEEYPDKIITKTDCKKIINAAIEYQNKYADDMNIQNSKNRLWDYITPVP